MTTLHGCTLLVCLDRTPATPNTSLFLLRTPFSNKATRSWVPSMCSARRVRHRMRKWRRRAPVPLKKRRRRAN